MNLSELLYEHFKNPRRVGALDDADVVVSVVDPTCGDMLKLWIRVADGRAADVRFKAFGCPGAIALGSLGAERIAGRSRAEIAALSAADCEALAGGLDDVRRHCAELLFHTLQKAVAAWPA